ncbi:MAG: hypothetical protein ACYC5V_03175 [Gemmatimonadaceae bacterium]
MSNSAEWRVRLSAVLVLFSLGLVTPDGARAQGSSAPLDTVKVTTYKFKTKVGQVRGDTLVSAGGSGVSLPPAPCTYTGAPVGLAAANAACQPCSAYLFEGGAGNWAGSPAPSGATCTPCARPGLGSYVSTGATCNTPRQLVAVLSAPGSGNTGTAVSGVTACSSYSGTYAYAIETWAINWGDGSGSWSTTGSCSAAPAHLYSTVGTYTITATVTNTKGDIAGTTTGTITITPPPCPYTGAGAIYITDPACTPCSSLYTEGSATLWSQHASCTACARPGLGTYWSGGATCTLKRNLYAAIAAPDSLIRGTTLSGLSGAGSTKDANAYAIAQWAWTFPSGTPATLTRTDGTVPSPPAWTVAGTYSISLTVSNGALDNPGTASKSIKVVAPCSYTGAPGTLFSTAATCLPCSSAYTEGSATLWRSDASCSACTRPGLGAYWSGGVNCATKRALTAVITMPDSIVVGTSPTGLAGTSSSGAAGAFPISQWAWTFPSGSPAALTRADGTVPSLPTWNTAGTYSVSLTVSNGGLDNPGTAAKNLKVVAACALTESPAGTFSTAAACVPCPRSGLGGYIAGGATCTTKRTLNAVISGADSVVVAQPLTISGTSSSAGTYAYPITQWAWTFPSGTPGTLSNATGTPSSSPAWGTAGTYAVNLTVSNGGLDNNGTASKSIKVVTACSYTEAPGTLFSSASNCTPCSRPGLGAYWSGGGTCAVPRTLNAVIIAPDSSLTGTALSPLSGATSTPGTYAYPITTWTWTFPSGSPSAGTYPSGTVSAPPMWVTAGTYTVTLVVSNGADNAGTATKAVKFVVPCTLTEVPAGTFSSSSSCSACTRPGLGAYWSGGTTCTTKRTLNAVATMPDSIVVGTALGASGTGSTSGTYAYPITQWAWTFPSGSPASLTNPTGTPSAQPTWVTPGTYLVSVTVSNGGLDNAGTTTKNVKVVAACALLEAPAATFSTATLCTPCTRPGLGGYVASGATCTTKRTLNAVITAPDSVLTASALGVTGTSSSAGTYAYAITNWAWSFPSGTPASLSNATGSPSSQPTWTAPGTYTISLTVSNGGLDNNGTASKSIKVVTPCSLVESPAGTFSTSSACVPCTRPGLGAYIASGTTCTTKRTLNAVITAPDSVLRGSALGASGVSSSSGTYAYAISTWAWTFPSGTPGSLSNASGTPTSQPTWATAGTYAVSLTVSNGGLDNAGTASKSLKVVAPCALTEAPAGTFSTAATCIPCTRPGLGAYIASGTTCSTKRALNAVITAPDSVLTGTALGVSGTSSSSGTYAYAISTWAWTFPSGTPGSLSNPSGTPTTQPTWATAGTYALSLTVSNGGLDNNGLATKNVKVVVPCSLAESPAGTFSTAATCVACARPGLGGYIASGATCSAGRNLYAAITASDSVVAGQPLAINGSSSYAGTYAYPITNWAWTFPSGSPGSGSYGSSAVSSPPTWTSAGFYTTTLTVSNGVDVSGSTSKSIKVVAKCALAEAPATMFSTSSSCTPCSRPGLAGYLASGATCTAKRNLNAVLAVADSVLVGTSTPVSGSSSYPATYGYAITSYAFSVSGAVNTTGQTGAASSMSVSPYWTSAGTYSVSLTVSNGGLDNPGATSRSVKVVNSCGYDYAPAGLFSTSSACTPCGYTYSGNLWDGSVYCSPCSYSGAPGGMGSNDPSCSACPYNGSLWSGSASCVPPPPCTLSGAPGGMLASDPGCTGCPYNPPGGGVWSGAGSCVPPAPCTLSGAPAGMLASDPGCTGCPYSPPGGGVWSGSGSCTPPPVCGLADAPGGMLASDPSCTGCPYSPPGSGTWSGSGACVPPAPPDPCPYNGALAKSDPSCTQSSTRYVEADVFVGYSDYDWFYGGTYTLWTVNYDVYQTTINGYGTVISDVPISSGSCQAEDTTANYGYDGAPAYKGTNCPFWPWVLG